MTLAAVSLSPFPQDPDYHRFADKRMLFGVPNFGDVISNFAFLFVGLAGLAFISGSGGRTVLSKPGEWLPYGVFFAALVLVTGGSAYYHWAPDNGPLFWDRLPITIAFMALLAAFIADRIDVRFGTRFALPGLVVVGAAVTYHWLLSEQAGRGDLRFYVLLQAVAVVSIVLMCKLFPGRNTTFRHVGWMLLWYGLGKVFEFSDRKIFLALDWVSGHTLKHLVSAVAIYMVLAMLKDRLEAMAAEPAAEA
ncbi:MAG: alkaline phytoceramidase [Rhodospirillales bacterium]|nr:alkaline phytoceramidase [Rhodospirillales bacterium]